MKIRKIERYDYDKVCDMLKVFAEETAFRSLKKHEYDINYAKKLLEYSCDIGLGLCAEEGGEIRGILLSIKDRDIWVPSVIRLKALAWYVKPKYRSSSIAARLFHEWTDQAEAMIKSGEIESFNLGQLETTPEVDLEKRGFRKTETHYMFGE